ncbi:microphthalmia-associated transcription factor-like isoform X2 [Anneissia japonica]|uniref:microphthalmia-associated transcription factor-like isoform X2 n=1 Tax=Anneissia japonica TaxID=1529436 RepID=UPI00142571D7|nr:microphthalmia-associated transcription factor-like isoform X2 [Anneissia japonica]
MSVVFQVPSAVANLGGSQRNRPLRRPQNLTSQMTSRANFKQQLMRQQVEQQEQLEQQQKANFAGPSFPQTRPIELQQQPQLATIPEVPKDVLVVKTKLQHPTRYHVQARQKQQVNEYLSKSTLSPGYLQQLSPNRNGSQSSMPNSPMSGTEVDIDELFSLQSNSIDFGFLDTDPLFPNTMPVSNTYLDQLGPNSVSVAPAAIPKTSSSCPADLDKLNPEQLVFTDEHTRVAYMKERQKKDNHNMIERRRRFNINDRIKELGTLIPKHADPDQRQNKGTILRSSVDYIKRLQREQAKYKEAAEKQRQLQAMNRRMMLRIQELEMRCQQQSIPTKAFSEETKTENIATDFLKLQEDPMMDLKIKTEPVTELDMLSLSNNLPLPEMPSFMSFDMNPSSMVVENMDEPSPILADPLLSASSSRKSSLTSMDDL